MGTIRGYQWGQQVQQESSRTQFLQSDAVRYTSSAALTAVRSPPPRLGDQRDSSRHLVFQFADKRPTTMSQPGFPLHLSRELLPRNMLEGKEGLDTEEVGCRGEPLPVQALTKTKHLHVPKSGYAVDDTLARFLLRVTKSLSGSTRHQSSAPFFARVDSEPGRCVGWTC